MAFVTMSKHGSESTVSPYRATVIRLEGSLIASVVPAVVGMFSMHAYLLHKERLSVSESIAITALRSILPIFIILINIPILIIMRGDPISSTFFAQFIKLISLPLAIIVFFFAVTLFYPHRIKRVASAFIWWWGKIKFFHVDKIIAFEERIFHEIDQLSKIFWMYLKKRKMMLLKASLWILLAFITDYFIAIAILWGFGFYPSVIKMLAVQCLMRPIIYLAPTPGGAGIWEFTYLGFFSLYMPQHVIGVAVLAWRILVTYFPCLIGAYYMSREFVKDNNLRDLLMRKGELPEEDLDQVEI
jgi:uncharacterized protein (TIRG00374 family)